MTELEFEKAARGTAPQVAGEYRVGHKKNRFTDWVRWRGWERHGEGAACGGEHLVQSHDSGSCPHRHFRRPRDARIVRRVVLRRSRFERQRRRDGDYGRQCERAQVHCESRQWRTGCERRGKCGGLGARTENFSGANLPNGGWGYRGGDFYNPELDSCLSRNVATFAGARRLFGLGFRAVPSLWWLKTSSVSVDATFAT